MAMKFELLHFYTTEKDLSVEDKKELLEWILKNNFVEKVETLSIKVSSEEDNNKFMEAYGPMLHRLLLKLEKEGKVKRCPKCNAIPLHPLFIGKGLIVQCTNCGYSEKLIDEKKPRA